MIADSGYDVGDLVARPSAGVLAGIGGAAVMLATFAGASGSGTDGSWLQQVGAAVLPASQETALPLAGIGLGVHLAIGAIFGALHAACQRRTSVAGLVTVGLFYGFILWLGSDVVLVRWLGVGPDRLESWLGLLAFELYGLTLAMWAVVWQRASAPVGGRTQPLD